MMRLATLELQKEDMKFCAGHFTVFSATEREHFHGHNFRVGVHITMPVNQNGMTGDYNLYKQKLRALCRGLNNAFLLPATSPYLTFREDETHWHVGFHEETMTFLKRDAQCLPIANITVEELSYWFVEQLLADQAMMQGHQVQAISARVFTDLGQAGRTDWTVAQGYATLPA